MAWMITRWISRTVSGGRSPASLLSVDADVCQPAVFVHRVTVGHAGHIVTDDGGGALYARFSGARTPVFRQQGGVGVEQAEQVLGQAFGLGGHAVDAPVAVHAGEQEVLD